MCFASLSPAFYCQLSDPLLRTELARCPQSADWTQLQPGQAPPGHGGPAVHVLVTDEHAGAHPPREGLLQLLVTHPQALPGSLLRRPDCLPDDYLLAPLPASEIAERAENLARTRQGGLRFCQVLEGFFHDPRARRAIWQGRLATLTVRESSLLRVLAAHAGAAVPRDDLLARLSPWGPDLGSNAVDVHVHALRAKLAPELIETVRSVGYRLSAQRPG